jgi:starvation-inducible DNA-binding protein
MFKSPSHLPEASRSQLAASLNARLADGLDLYTQLKTAHWNIKGPSFAALHPLLDEIASSVLEQNDAIAERAVTLGGIARGSLRAAAKNSRLEEAPEATRDTELVRALVGRVAAYLVGVRESRAVADELRDVDTADLLTQAATDLEKYGWFLNASLGE